MRDCLPHIEAGSEMIARTLSGGKAVLTCGNGGSAATAQHFTAELVGRYVAERGALRGICLNTDTSAMTAIANDYGFEKVFSRQVRALGRPGDVLVAFTTSGASPNVLEAIEEARKVGLEVIVLTGAKGAGLRERRGVRVCVAVASQETARIQELHDFVIHAWCEALDAALKEKKGNNCNP
jgi:D-sedoheptulose 7-phosphate isomerase